MEKDLILHFQRKELTEYFIYLKLSQRVKTVEKREALLKIANDELKHHDFWRELSHQEVTPNRYERIKILLISKLLGNSFGIKAMENEERRTQQHYKKLVHELPELSKIIHEEHLHEEKMIHILKENKIHYIGAIVLSLNDSLVELTGALAGFTLAFEKTRLIALAALVTGFSATFSIAASEYLAQKAEQKSRKEATRSSLYAGTTYIITALLLTIPFFLLNNPYIAIVLTIFCVIVIIAAFNYYISVVKEVPFKKKFWVMVLLSLSIAFISFIVGFAIREILGVSI